MGNCFPDLSQSSREMQKQMPVFCPYCEKESTDSEFCDHCNRELNQPVLVESPPTSVTTPDGMTIACDHWSGSWPSDPESFFLHIQDGNAWRVHGIAPGAWGDLKQELELRSSIQLSVLPRMSWVESQGGAVIAAEDWRQPFIAIGGPKRNHLGDWGQHLHNLLNLCRMFVAELTELHAAGFVWLTFDPGAFETRNDRLRITNLDCRLFPRGMCPSKLRISPRYSPPEVCEFDGSRIGPATDVYHVAIMAYYWLAALENGFPGAGLYAFRHQLPPLRLFQPNLPPGIAPVLQQGLAPDQSNRPQSLKEFIDTLAIAIDEALARYQPSAPSVPRPRLLRRLWDFLVPPKVKNGKTLEVGYCCVVGAAKSALNAVNQDTVCCGKLTEDSAWLLVADGVTTCRAGSGELASQLAAESMGAALQRLTRSTSDSHFETIVQECLATTSTSICNRALAAHDGSFALNDSDLMSTTVVAALCTPDRLHLANVGDSRAYLVTDRFIDQLTIDGDSGTAQLIAGSPPEQTRDMGVQAKALRTCAGAARVDADGCPTPDLARCVPQLSHWHLRAGDIVLLCSDGLVDEGVFLDPSDVYRSIQERKQFSAQSLAECLVAEANARQRLPSAAEPQGFGDNIACIIVKVLPSPSSQ